MAGNTKYTAASQRDPDETASYTQAPPSYADEAANDQATLLGGAPRSSEDNIPDDFKVGFKARRYRTELMIL